MHNFARANVVDFENSWTRAKWKILLCMAVKTPFNMDLRILIKKKKKKNMDLRMVNIALIYIYIYIYNLAYKNKNWLPQIFELVQ